jgi:hypothetical protein
MNSSYRWISKSPGIRSRTVKRRVKLPFCELLLEPGDRGLMSLLGFLECRVALAIHLFADLSFVNFTITSTSADGNS